jgi:hypothetical protein
VSMQKTLNTGATTPPATAGLDLRGG